MHKTILYPISASALAALLLLGGCATPNYETVSRTQTISPDAADNLGGTGIESDDVRTIATRMTASLMSVPEIYASGKSVRIALAPVRNSTRFMIDTGIFTTRLRAEMNSISQGRVRFFAQEVAQSERTQLLWERDRTLWQQNIDNCAAQLIDAIRSSGKPLPAKVAVLQTSTLKLEDGVDADSILSMVRARMAQETDAVRFLARESSGRIGDAILNEAEARDLGLVDAQTDQKIAGTDYFIGGELIAENLTTARSGYNGDAPNDNLVLSLRLTEAGTGVVQREVSLPVKTRVSSGTERADYILSGEMRGISKASGGGDRSDYILMSFQMIDPVSNELIWEDIYETKKVTNSGVIYK